MSEITGFCAIDLGTTNSSVARFNGRAPEVIPVDGEQLMRSVVAIMPADKAPENERFLIGQDALDAAARDRTVRKYLFQHIKRHRAEKWNDDEATGEMFVPGPDGMTHYKGPDGFTFSPQELEAALIIKLKRAADEKVKRGLNAVVLTVPTSSSPSQRKAAEAAAREAGFEHVELMDESTAAALAYGYSRKSKKRNVICVIDVGGGTTDVTVMEVGGDFVGVLGTGGSSITGGSDCDRRLGAWALEKWSRDQPDSDLSADEVAKSLILSEAEETKKRLSRKIKTEFRIDDIDKSADGIDLPMVYELDRATLENLVAELLVRMEEACYDAIADVRRRDPKFTIGDIHDVVLVGGGTRMPAVQEMAKRVFRKEPKTDIDPEVAVVLGAALQAAILEGQLSDITISDILAYSVCVETYDKVAGVATRVIEKGASYPSKEVIKRELVNRDAGQTSMPVRILIGNSDRVEDCELLYSFDFDIEPGPAQKTPIALEIALNGKGEPFGICGGETFGSAA